LSPKEPRVYASGSVILPGLLRLPSFDLLLALAVPTIAVNLAYFFADAPALSIANLALLAIFYAHVIRCLLGYVLRDAVVTLDDLFAAICSYLMIALVFACLYATSTGFGDIHPVARQARAIVMIQQVTGVMYVALLIARLTGMNLVRR
jgi:hypothetical protein